MPVVRISQRTARADLLLLDTTYKAILLRCKEAYPDKDCQAVVSVPHENTDFIIIVQADTTVPTEKRWLLRLAEAGESVIEILEGDTPDRADLLGAIPVIASKAGELRYVTIEIHADKIATVYIHSYSGDLLHELQLTNLFLHQDDTLRKEFRESVNRSIQWRIDRESP